MTDYTVADTIYAMFTTRAFATGIPTVLSGSPVISAYENDSATQITAGITLGVSHDSVVGMNLLTIVATGANGYEAGKDYNLVVTTGTVGGVSVVGEVVGTFSLSRSAAAVDLANGTDGLGAIKTDTAAILVDTAVIGAAGAGLTDLGGMSTGMKAEVNAEADTALTDYDGPTNAEMEARTLVAASYFDPAADAVANVTLVATTTTNTDMVGTDNALLASAAPTNWSSMVVSGAGSVDSLTQGYLNTLLTEATGGRIAGNFDVFFENADALTTQVVDDVGGGGGGTDWTASERNEIRGRLGVTGTTAAGGNTPTLALEATVAGLNDLSAADVNAEVDTALTDYDGPTNAEMEARTIAAAAYFDPAADTVANVTLVATTTTNTDMRGTDSAATATNLATVDSNIDAIKVKTDKLTFTSGNDLDANIQKVNDVTVTGDGELGTEWGPV